MNTQAEITKIVDATLRGRRSTRAFLPKPVAQTEIKAILDVAARAPSGTNTQPWQVYVLTGDAKTALSDEIIKAFYDPEALELHRKEFDDYPAHLGDPYLARRRKVGLDLYGLLGLGRDDRTGMQAQMARNYVFFDAPVGLIFTIDRVLSQGSLMDYGMFMQNIMIAARGRGLDTCPQAAFNPFHRIIEKHLNLGSDQKVICAMALGYADHGKIENTLVTEREPVERFAHFLS